jgi:catechol 2,3-dioxygenase-like lactoylglutathione lyase family enzyme
MRLRQVCLVAKELEPAVADLTSVLGLEVAYRDPMVIYFGLKNAVMPIGGDFLEVVSPVQENTAAGRYLERRGGNGGYMLLLQCTDALAERKRIEALGIRTVFTLDNPEYRATHFHPGDMGGVLLSVDSVAPGADSLDPMCMWEPGGPDWQLSVRTDVVSALVGAELQCQDPAALAALWSRVLGLPVAQVGSGEPCIQLQNGTLRFVRAVDGRGSGVGGFDLKVVDQLGLLAAAADRGCDHSDEQVMVCGTRINLV